MPDLVHREVRVDRAGMQPPAIGHAHQRQAVGAGPGKHRRHFGGILADMGRDRLGAGALLGRGRVSRTAGPLPRARAGGERGGEQQDRKRNAPAHGPALTR